MLKKQATLNYIEQALDNVRPYLRSDGGDVRFIELTKDMIVKIQFMGACEHCTVNFMTLEHGIEREIKQLVPDIKEVVSI